MEKQDLLINMDSQAPNVVFQEYVESGRFLPNVTRLQPEYTYGDSRFDFYLEQGGTKHLIEVKGVTLEQNGIAMFPDALTERGIKHIKGLMAAHTIGFQTWIVFVVQMEGMRFFTPNDRTHPEFGTALRAAYATGVHVLALECSVAPDSLVIAREIPVQL